MRGVLWRRSRHAGTLARGWLALTLAIASLTYGLLAWHASAFNVEGVLLYDNGWMPHPTHFIAGGLALIGPALVELAAPATRPGERHPPQDTTPPARSRAAAADQPDAAACAEQRAAATDDPAAAPPRTFFRTVKSTDREELLALAQDSRDLHAPWIEAPLTPHAFKVYLRRTERDDHHGFAICLRDSGRIVGVVNINNVVGGSMLSASIAYYIGRRHADRGYMREGLMQIMEHAFGELRLHRLEANIQPGNTTSIALARSCGFVHEGLARRYLFIDGAWRDHERWAAIDDREHWR